SHDRPSGSRPQANRFGSPGAEQYLSPTTGPMASRRTFLQSTAAAAAVAAIPRQLHSLPTLLTPLPTRSQADIVTQALDAARDAGASYADARVGRYRRQGVSTRERQITGVSDTESYGLGVRVLVDGAWGFAGTSDLSPDGVQQAAREAARIARAGKRVQKRPVELAPLAAQRGEWKTPVRGERWEWHMEEKVGWLFAANEAALGVPNVRFVTSGMRLLREEKTLGPTDGTLVTQTFYRVGPSFTATAIAQGDFQSY